MNRIRWIYCLAVIGFVSISFTKWRLGPIGISEVSFLFAAILSRNMAVCKSQRSSYGLFKYTCMSILCIMFIGTLWNFLSIHNVNDSVLHNLLAYCYDAFILSYLWHRLPYEHIFAIIKISIVFTIIFNAFLFFVNSNYFFYSNRFSGLACNPNQLAIAFLPLPVFIFNAIESERRKLRNIFWLCLLVCTVYIGYSIDSQALFVAWIISTYIILFQYLLLKSSRNSQMRAFILLILFIAFVFFSVSVAKIIIHLSFYTQDFFGSRGQNESAIRYLLWKIGVINTLSYSPIFGFGFGNYIDVEGMDLMGRYEAHNTYIDILIESGILGLMIFCFLLVKITLKTIRHRNSCGFSLMASLLVFSSFHFMLREPMFWIILYFSYISSYYVKQGRTKLLCVD